MYIFIWFCIISKFYTKHEIIRRIINSQMQNYEILKHFPVSRNSIFCVLKICQTGRNKDLMKVPCFIDTKSFRSVLFYTCSFNFFPAIAL